MAQQCQRHKIDYNIKMTISKKMNTLAAGSLTIFISAAALYGCAGQPKTTEQDFNVSLEKLSHYATKSKITHMVSIDAREQTFIVTEAGGIFLDRNGQEAELVSHGGEINKIQLDKTGNLLMISSRDRIKITDLSTNKTIWDKMDSGSSGDQMSAMSPSGDAVYAFSKIWHLDKSSRIFDIVYPAAPINSEISGDGQFLLNTGLNGHFDLVRMSDGKYLHRWDTGDTLAGGTFSLDQNRLYITNGANNPLFDKKWDEIDVYEVSSTKKLKELAHSGNLTTVVLSQANGDIFTGTDTGDIYHWSAQTLELLHRWLGKGWVHTSAADNTGRIWFGTEHGELKVYDPEINGLSTIKKLASGISKLAVSKNGDTLIVATFNGQTRNVVTYRVNP